MYLCAVQLQDGYRRIGEGYDVDVAKGVAEIIGADLEFVCQQWDGMIPTLLANKFDLIVASMSITESRLEKIDFSNPYRDSVGRIIGKSGQQTPLFDDTGAPIATNFEGLPIGVERASTYENWFNAKLPDANIALYDGNEEMYLDLVNGRVDGVIKQLINDGKLTEYAVNYIPFPMHNEEWGDI